MSNNVSSRYSQVIVRWVSSVYLEKVGEVENATLYFNEFLISWRINVFLVDKAAHKF